MNIKKLFSNLTFSLYYSYSTGCYEHLPLRSGFYKNTKHFFNQDSVKVQFPKIIKDKITVLRRFTLIVRIFVR